VEEPINPSGGLWGRTRGFVLQGCGRDNEQRSVRATAACRVDRGGLDWQASKWGGPKRARGGNVAEEGNRARGLSSAVSNGEREA